jgi:nucleoside-diphosphate-sugar epimerase
MKILITGANGELGSDLVNLLVKKKHKVYAIYRNNKKKILVKNKNLIWVRHDFCEKLIKKFKVDILINCIAAHNFSKKKKISDLINSNIIAIKNIIKFAGDNRVKLVVNLSTISIYGDVDKPDLKEEYKPKHVDNLGLTKFCGELLLADSSVNYINLRLPGVLTSSKNYGRPWLKTIIKKIKNNKTVSIYNHKFFFNNVIDTHEINNFINYLLEKRLFKKKIRNSFNLAALKAEKMIDIILFIKKYFSSSSKIMIKKKSTKNYSINISKIRNKTKFLPSTTLDIIKRNVS